MIRSHPYTGRVFPDRGYRPLQLDHLLRHVVLGGMAHGPSPLQRENSIFNQLVLNFVLRGSGTYTDASGRRYPLEPGTLFHRYPGVVHSTWIDPDSDYAETWLVCDATTGTQLLEAGLIDRRPVLEVGADQIVFDEFRRLCRRVALPEIELGSRALLLEALAYVDSLYERARRGAGTSTTGRWDRTITEGCRLLQHDLDERVSMEAIARRLGVPYTAFRRRFTRAQGVSPGDYRIRRRIEAAQRLLMTRSVKQVAIALGYPDPFALSAQFKKFTGVSPSAFQRGVGGAPAAPADAR